MKTAAIIRHVAFEDLGSFQAPLRARDFDIRYFEAGMDTLDQAADADLLVVLGGPIGAMDDEDYPFLVEEVALLERRLDKERPTLGICLGAQLMARALGADVAPQGVKEIGWSPLTLTEAGKQSPLSLLDPDLAWVLHWHGDAFTIPEGAERLASTEICPNQAFALGRFALGLQFHAEATGRGLERWFIGHCGEINATPGISVPSLRADTKRRAGALEMQGPLMFQRWLDEAGL